MKRIVLISMAAALAVGVLPVAHAVTIRVATLAPRNSSWMKYFRRMARGARKGTEGRVKFKFYPDGAMGDEALVVEKMRLGQLQGAAVTNVGLGKIAPELLVQQLPMLFSGYRALDCLREKMAGTFNKMVEDKGYVVLGYGDVGYIYVFTNEPAETPEDLKDSKFKMFAWVDDPIGREVQNLAGINSVPLAVPDVLSSLQTGQINAFVNAPYAAIALQWFTNAKYIINIPLNILVGAVVVRKEVWDKLSEADQKVVREVAAKWTGKLNHRIRRDNRRAVKALKKAGLTVIKVPKAKRKLWYKLARRVHRHFAGKLYSRKLLKQVKQTLRECRRGG